MVKESSGFYLLGGRGELPSEKKKFFLKTKLKSISNTDVIFDDIKESVMATNVHKCDFSL